MGMAQQPNIASAGIAAQSGDVVTIDFKGSIQGVPFQGGAGKDYDLQLGSKSFIPGFEDQLIGVKAGESRDVKVTFPANYQSAEVAGKEAVFAVQVKKIQPRMAAQDQDAPKEYSEAEKQVLAMDARLQQLNQAEAKAGRKLQDALKTATGVMLAGAAGGGAAAAYGFRHLKTWPRIAVSAVGVGAGGMLGLLARKGSVQGVQMQLLEAEEQSAAFRQTINRELAGMEAQFKSDGAAEDKQPRFSERVSKAPSVSERAARLPAEDFSTSARSQAETSVKTR